MIAPLEALALGVVEGVTEFLPISSTGHLILAARLLGLRGEAVDGFTIVIQAGALVAVLGLYRVRVRSIWRGVLGRDASGWALLQRLLISSLPVWCVGAALHRTIKARLFDIAPIAAALAVGGVFMLWLDRWLQVRAAAQPRRSCETLTHREALLIGLLQCLSLWPGTSRAMVTIGAGLLLGLQATAAAEYSFLLALPSLGAATLFELASDGAALSQAVPLPSMAGGFLAACAVAALTMRGLLAYLARRGLAVFGWYRIGLAALVIWAGRL